VSEPQLPQKPPSPVNTPPAVAAPVTEKPVKKTRSAPLAERMRPTSIFPAFFHFLIFLDFEDFLGQENVTSGILGPFLNAEKITFLPSIILFGPPGVGKVNKNTIFSVFSYKKRLLLQNYWLKNQDLNIQV
jgi:replication-associated recombination protein RarA